MNNLTSLTWWQQAWTATPKPAPRPTIAPEQIILAAFKVDHVLTQGMLLDLCRQQGANINYPTLRSHLARLQQEGAIRSSFVDHIVPGLPVLVYQRS
jgi:hypothetical protein